MLQLQNVSINIDGLQIIKDISFNIEKGNVLSIVGESGVGKTTLLRAVSGLLDVQGMITLDDQRVIGPSDKLVHGVEGVTTVFQDYQLMHNRTVYENIAYPLRAYVEEEQRSQTEELLQVLMLDSHKDHYPQELSGGQKQRVSIARALASKPTLLLLDEPFSNMNVALKEVIKEHVLTYLKNERITAILATHDPKDALAISDQIAVLKSGMIVQLASANDIYETPFDEYVMSCFGHCNFWTKESFLIDFEQTSSRSDFNSVGVRVENLNLVKSTLASCDIMVKQNIYQGGYYLLRGQTKSGKEVYFQNSHAINEGTQLSLGIAEEKINYFI